MNGNFSRCRSALRNASQLQGPFMTWIFFSVPHMCSLTPHTHLSSRRASKVNKCVRKKPFFCVWIFRSFTSKICEKMLTISLQDDKKDMRKKRWKLNCWELIFFSCGILCVFWCKKWWLWELEGGFCEIFT